MGALADAATPPDQDDPYYLELFRTLCIRLHPAVAAIEAAKEIGGVYPGRAEHRARRIWLVRRCKD